jgi:hypothetical protein
MNKQEAQALLLRETVRAVVASEMAWRREDLMWFFQPRGSGAEVIFCAPEF